MNLPVHRAAPQLLGGSPVYTSWQPDSTLGFFCLAGILELLVMCWFVGLLVVGVFLKVLVKFFSGIIIFSYTNFLPTSSCHKDKEIPIASPGVGMRLYTWSWQFLHRLQQPHHHSSEEGIPVGEKPEAITYCKDSAWEVSWLAHIQPIILLHRWSSSHF